MKYYFIKGIDDICFSKQYWIDHTNENNLSNITLFEAEHEHGTGYFYCDKFNVVGEVNQSCNKIQCDQYKPRNKKGGICSHHRLPMTHGKEITIKIKQL